MSKYSNKDAARDTNSSSKEVSRAWHDARDHAASDGSLDERNVEKTSDSSALADFMAIFTGKDD